MHEPPASTADMAVRVFYPISLSKDFGSVCKPLQDLCV
jgi:hypothetical protein